MSGSTIYESYEQELEELISKIHVQKKEGLL